MTNVVKMQNSEDDKIVMIDGWVIRQDAEGRYCLNDLHKAAGSNPKQKPAEWLRYSTAKELIEELKVGNPTFCPIDAMRGRTGGTFAVKELVYAYAMWISSEYHLKVIRAYDRLATEGVAVHEDNAQNFLDDPLSYFEKLLTQAKELKAAKELIEKEAKIAQPKVEFYDQFVDSNGTYTFREVCKMLGVKEKEFRTMLVDSGVMYKLNKSWIPYEKHISAGRFEVKVYVDNYGMEFTNAKFTSKGVQYCANLAVENNLLKCA